MEYRFRYEYTTEFGHPRHQWSCVGRRGGIHLHIVDMGEEHGAKYGERYSGGIEIHWRTPPAYMENDAPSHDHCFLLKAPCWHDGSSLQATEYWIPMWLTEPNDHDRMFGMLGAEMGKQFEGDYGDA